jgi:phage terminase small subunit
LVGAFLYGTERQQAFLFFVDIFWGRACKIPIILTGAAFGASPMPRETAERGESMLTAKQEKFVQGIIEGKSQADAYRSAYSTKNMTDKAIYIEASSLMDNPKVSLRLTELRNQMMKSSIMSAQKRLEWLSNLIANDEEGTSDKLKAIDIMNKMQGEYVQKVEADVKSEVTINIELSDDDE